MPVSACIVWGPELSPFLLKLESMLAWRGIPFRRLPRDGTRLENLRTMMRVNTAIRTRTALRPPANDVLDEFPLVPFLLTSHGQVLYDTTALASWLDQTREDRTQPLVPADAVARFVAAVIDEAFDEFGLYMVHHNRWKLAAGDNGGVGRRLAQEYSRHLPPGTGPLFAGWFERRQVRRLPYLFSVAPAGYCVPGLAASRTPPSRAGFPPTHELLELAWQRHLGAMEAVLAAQPFLLGNAFTIADASAYGQLSMNLNDDLAASRLREVAPRTFDWLVAIRDRRHVGSSGAPVITARLRPLLDVVFETFVPLMQANAAACAQLLARGERRFNEQAFDAGVSLYGGVLLGHPYRSVAKTFQARAWRDLCSQWAGLSGKERQRLQELLPGYEWTTNFAQAARR